MSFKQSWGWVDVKGLIMESTDNLEAAQIFSE